MRKTNLNKLSKCPKLFFLELSVGCNPPVFPQFQIFFLVVLFGLFHGLVFLPVALSLLGPEPYGGGDQDGNESNANSLSTDLNREERRSRKVSPVTTISVRPLKNDDAGLGLDNPCFQGV